MYENEFLFVSEKTGKIMRGMRVQLNCTQAEFGGKIGVSQPVISAIEAGRTRPSIDMVRNLAARFGLDPKCITGQKPMAWSAL